MKFLFIFLLALAVYCFVCKKEDESPYVPVKRCPELTNNMNTLSMYIKGKWQFVEEKRIARYNGTEYFTPTSQGWGHQTIIFSDTTAQYFIDNRLDSNYRYRILWQCDITNYPLDSIPVLTFFSLSTGQRIYYVPIFICNNQLLLSYWNSFNSQSLWIRK